MTGEVHEAYDGLNTIGDDLVVEQASGPGGNGKVTRSWSAQIDVVRRWGQDHPDGEYQMFTPDLWTTDAHGTTTDLTLVAAATLEAKPERDRALRRRPRAFASDSIWKTTFQLFQDQAYRNKRE